MSQRILKQAEQWPFRVAAVPGIQNVDYSHDPGGSINSAPPVVSGPSEPSSAPTAPGAPQAPKAPATPGGTGGPGPATNYSPNAGVDQWTPQVEEALRRNGLPTTPDYVDKVKKQMQSESSGNPKAINNSDSNAIAGHPSQGLMQTIPSTFQQYHLPGDSNDITDPQANLDAAVGYGKSRYGPTLMDESGNGIGSGHGY